MGESKLVLVMEDLEMYGLPLKEQLDHLGYQSNFTASRQKFLHSFDDLDLPYAIILDNNVPRYDGEFPEVNVGSSIAMTLKRHHPEVRIALHTSSDGSDRETFDKMITEVKLKGVIYLPKPVSTEILKEFLER
ncbi:Uncharacterised protein [uncultured archaeon]|nr:Uncharacterised protein [uncultured archaeon]